MSSAICLRSTQDSGLPGRAAKAVQRQAYCLGRGLRGLARSAAIFHAGISVIAKVDLSNPSHGFQLQSRDRIQEAARPAVGWKALLRSPGRNGRIRFHDGQMSGRSSLAARPQWPGSELLWMRRERWKHREERSGSCTSNGRTSPDSSASMAGACTTSTRAPPIR